MTDAIQPGDIIMLVDGTILEVRSLTAKQVRARHLLWPNEDIADYKTAIAKEQADTRNTYMRTVRRQDVRLLTDNMLALYSQYAAENKRLLAAELANTRQWRVTFITGEEVTK